MAITLNGRVWTTAILAGADGRDYARPETITSSGAPLWDLFFSDFAAQISTATAIQGIAPGAAAGFLRSTGSAWARVSGVDPATDINATVAYQKGGTGLTALGTSLQYIRTNAGVNAIEFGSVGFPKYAILTGTVADSLVSGAFTKRTISTEVYDPDGIVSITSSVFALNAGTYVFYGESSCHSTVNGATIGFVARIRNTSDSTTAAMGVGGRAWGAATTSSGCGSCAGIQTIASAKNFELQQMSMDATGVGGAYASDTLASVFITKIA